MPTAADLIDEIETIVERASPRGGRPVAFGGTVRRSSSSWRWTQSLRTEGSMDALPVTRSDSVRLAPDPRRVIAKPFLPREEIYPDGSSRMQVVLERILAMSDVQIAETLDANRGSFEHRHRDLDSVLERNFAGVAARLGHLELLAEPLSANRRHLIGVVLHTRVLDRGGRARESVDRPGARPIRPGWRAAALRDESASDRRRPPVIDRVPLRCRRC